MGGKKIEEKQYIKKDRKEKISRKKLEGKKYMEEKWWKEGEKKKR